jgi:hypothetical protein
VNASYQQPNTVQVQHFNFSNNANNTNNTNNASQSKHHTGVISGLLSRHSFLNTLKNLNISSNRSNNQQTSAISSNDRAQADMTLSRLRVKSGGQIKSILKRSTSLDNELTALGLATNQDEATNNLCDIGISNNRLKDSLVLTNNRLSLAARRESVNSDSRKKSVRFASSGANSAGGGSGSGSGSGAASQTKDGATEKNGGTIRANAEAQYLQSSASNTSTSKVAVEINSEEETPHYANVENVRKGGSKTNQANKDTTGTGTNNFKYANCKLFLYCILCVS